MTRSHDPAAQPDRFGATSPFAPADMPATPPDEAGSVPQIAAVGAPSPADLLAELARWVDLGWLRPLDRAWAALLVEQCPDAGAELPLAAALLAHNEGRGHTCLPLGELLASGGAAAGLDPWLAGPPDAQVALQELLARVGTDPARWRDALAGSDAVDVEDDAEHAARGGQRTPAPMVLDGQRLYLRRHHRDERRVASSLLARVEAFITVDDAADEPPRLPDPAEVAVWLTRLFPPPPPDDDRFDWQRAACALALRGRLALITGGPGTGKTYTVARLLALVFALHGRSGGRSGGAVSNDGGTAARPLRIALAAPTGKAAARLQQSIEDALAALAAAQPEALDWAALRQAFGQAQTLHRLLGARPDTRGLRHGAHRPLEVDLLVVDEASMVHLEMMAALLRALPPSARLVLLGDQDQLASVEAGAVLGDLCANAAAGRYDAETAAWVAACTGQALSPEYRQPDDMPAPPLAQQTVMLRHSHRFSGAIGALAVAVNRSDAAAARHVLEAGRAAAERIRVNVAQPGDAAQATVASLAHPSPADAVAVALHGRTGTPASGIGYRQVFEVLRGQRPAAGDAAGFGAWAMAALRAFDRSRVLCAVREGEWGVAGLNAAIEAELRRLGLIGRGALGPGSAGEWYEGRPVMVTRNDPALGVHNGDIGLALKVPGAAAGEPLRVYFADGDRPRGVMASRLAAIETAWAMTVHKSQGSEFGHTVLALPPELNPVLTRELVYTGITRAREAFTLLLPEPAVLDGAVQRRTRRASGLRERLV